MPDTTALGKYRVLAELGRGGFATVYRAEDMTLNREVALKILHPQLLTEPDWVERFHREARAIAQLRHPHIVTIYEIGETDGRLYIAMELIATGSVEKYLKDHVRFSWQRTLSISSQITDALSYAHTRGVLHRDLKPANIMVDARGDATITDFGFAKLLQDSSRRLTLSGDVVGTPAYVAPEIWNGADPTPQTDIYAFGCTVYEMVTGQQLFQGRTPSLIIRKHLIDGPQFPDTWPSDTPPGLEDVLRQALAPELENRYTSPLQMMTALEALNLRTVEHESRSIPITHRNHEGRGQQRSLELEQYRTPDENVIEHKRSQLLHKVRAHPVWFMVVVLLLLISAWGIRLALRSQNPTTHQDPALGESRLRKIDEMIMVYVPAGTFEMGKDVDNGENVPVYREDPVHTVRLSGFWIDQKEVSVYQFRQFAEATGYQTTAELQGWSYGWTQSGWEPISGANWINPKGPTSRASDSHPVVHVSWDDAMAYCEWVGGRLPTEAEWEFSARGTEGHLYPWGSKFECALGNFDDEVRIDKEVVAGGVGCDSYEVTAPVGSFPNGKSWVGALDLSGNVWEWVLDWYGEYPDEPQDNPTGPTHGEHRVLRGGSWKGREVHVHSAIRNINRPNVPNDDSGFRCVTHVDPEK